MDLNTITIILAIIAIVPTVGGLIIQAKREKKQTELEDRKAAAQAEIDKINATSNATSIASTASSNVIITLQGETDRLSKRVIELEAALIAKTTQIGELMMAKIDSESETATMKYKLETMQVKLNSLLPVAEHALPLKKKDTVPLKIKQTLLANEERKNLVAQEISKEVEQLKSGSIANGRNFYQGE